MKSSTQSERRTWMGFRHTVRWREREQSRKERLPSKLRANLYALGRFCNAKAAVCNALLRHEEQGFGREANTPGKWAVAELLPLFFVDFRLQMMRCAVAGRRMQPQIKRDAKGCF